MSNLALQPEKSTSDDEAADLFRRHWDIYRKVVENDYMSHQAAYRVLADVLASEVNRPFSFADLACGDAYSSSRGLAGTQVEEYIGIDLSEWALGLAEQELRKVGARRRLVCGRFQDIDRHLGLSPDIVWVGLSIHHLSVEEKQEFIRRVRRVLAPGGLFLIYEPVLAEEEKVENYASRFKKVAAGGWVNLTVAELDAVCDHVRDFDMPELPATWARLGRDAGFDSVDCLYTDPTGLYSLFKYS